MEEQTWSQMDVCGCQLSWALKGSLHPMMENHRKQRWMGVGKGGTQKRVGNVKNPRYGTTTQEEKGKRRSSKCKVFLLCPQANKTPPGAAKVHTSLRMRAAVG